MSERSYSVVVNPERWPGELEGLARLLVSVTGHSTRGLAKALSRGPVTLDADLRREEADSLFERIRRLEVPVAIRDQQGRVVERGGPGSGSESTGEPATDEAQGDADVEEGFEVELGSILDDFDFEEALSGEDGAGEGAIADGDVGTDEEAWTPADRHPEGGAFRLSTGPDGEVRAERSTGAMSLDEAAAEQVGEHVDDWSDEQSGEPDRASSEPSAPKTSEGWRGTTPAEDRRAFDSLAMTEVLTESEGLEDQGPSGGGGFDDRSEHIPPLAVLLSLAAPGAGQIYNGDKEEGRRLGFTGLLLIPWLLSISSAWRSAEKVRRERAPRPPEDSLKSALGHVVLWWLVVGSSAALLVVGGDLLWEMSQEESATSEALAEADRESALTQARINVQEARIAARGAAAEERKKVDRFTMDRRERAARLFRIGLEHCRARKFEMCQTAMRKVGELSGAYRRRAFRLQAWASSQANPDMPRREMPEIELKGETLSEYESQQLRESTGDAGDSTASREETQ